MAVCQWKNKTRNVSSCHLQHLPGHKQRYGYWSNLKNLLARVDRKTSAMNSSCLECNLLFSPSVKSLLGHILVFIQRGRRLVAPPFMDMSSDVTSANPTLPCLCIRTARLGNLITNYKDEVSRTPLRSSGGNTSSILLLQVELTVKLFPNHNLACTLQNAARIFF